MNRSMLLRSALVLATLLVTAQSCLAATDGTLGLTSTGSTTITVTVPNLIKISGISDLAFGTYSGAGDLNSNDNICIYTNKASGTYKVTASGSGAGGAFTLANGASTLNYLAYYNDVASTTGESSLSSGSTLAGQTGANTTSQTCGGGSNANFHVKILAANLLSVPSGSYSGTLTLLVEPQ